MDTLVRPYTSADMRFAPLWPTLSSRRSVSRIEVRSLSFRAPSAYLGGRIAPGWKIVQLLPVRVEQDDDGCYIISDDLFAVYGEGSTRVEAQRDYVVALIDYYQLLSARTNDPLAQAQFRRLQRYLQPVYASQTS